MSNSEDSEKNRKLDLELFLSSHNEEELALLRNLIDKLILEKKNEKEQEVTIPLSIFLGKLNPGEALVKYLKENKNLRFCNISRLLNKKENGIWLNYKRAEKKSKIPFEISEKDVFIPLYFFKNQALSYLESIVFYLRISLKMSNKEVSKLLKKSSQVVSIAYNRAKSKLK